MFIVRSAPLITTIPQQTQPQDMTFECDKEKDQQRRAKEAEKAKQNAMKERKQTWEDMQQQKRAKAAEKAERKKVMEERTQEEMEQ